LAIWAERRVWIRPLTRKHDIRPKLPASSPSAGSPQASPFIFPPGIDLFPALVSRMSWTFPSFAALPANVWRSSRRLADAAAAVPRLTLNAVRWGVLPSGACAALTVLREGFSELHWKAAGDALVRFAQHSGPLLTKLGQVLATRNDVLPDAVCTRLEALYTDQPPMRRRQLFAALRAAFPHGSPFRRIDRHPMAVGSIAQVHRAELADGQRVIVKLVRPGLRRAIERDLNAAEVLLDLLLRLPGCAREATRLAVSRALRDLGTALRSEVDLRHEAQSLEEFGRRLRANPRVRVPRIYRQWCSESLLVMEELVGEALSVVRARAKADPETARRVADLALKEILAQVFDDGRFHADPHAGNLLILPDGRLGLIDLGLTGESREQDRLRVAKAVRAFVSGDPELLARALLEFGRLPPEFSYEAFKADVAAVTGRHEGRVVAQVIGANGDNPSKHNHLEDLVQELFKVAYRHNMYVPPSTTLLIKTVVTIEGVARSLNPNINVVATALPIVFRSLTRRWFKWSGVDRVRGLVERFSSREPLVRSDAVIDSRGRAAVTPTP
jgi:ubiquinone biosynthesis protein